MTSRIVSLFVLLAAPLAHAAQCVDDTPPRPSGAPKTPCDDSSVCSGPADDATHYAGGTLVYFPATPIDLGACNHSQPLAFGNGCTDARASCNNANRCVVQYIGLLSRPAAAPLKAPAVIVVPGSTGCTTMGGVCVRTPGRFCGLKNALLAQSYVVLELLPRGYGTDATHLSTGWYVSDASSQMKAMGAPCASKGLGACGTTELLDEGRDVEQAYKYLAGRSFVNHAAIGVFGHSLGAIRALAFNRHDHGQKAVVAPAAGSESWCAGTKQNTFLHDALRAAIDSAVAPTYTFQPTNDVNLESGAEIANEAALNRKQYQSTFFPPVTANGLVMQYGDEAHFCFTANQRDTDLWFPSVLDFLRRYNVK